MTPRLLLASAALAFVLLATANSAGYRYGVSDQSFYVPAIALKADSSLFPRDRDLLAPQMRLWFGGDLLAWLEGATGSLPFLFALLYVFSLLLLFAAAVTFAGHLGWDRWTTGAFLLLLTLRHRIAKTGANTLEGYMHPRMVAFAFGLLALACAVRRRFALAILLVIVAGIVHPTTAAWFAVVVCVAAWWPHRRSALWQAGAAMALVATAVGARVWLGAGFVRMDSVWLAVIGDKDYLFATGWPVYAWVINLAYPVVIVTLYRRRLGAGCAVEGEDAIVAGLVALAAVFLLSVPFTAMHVALAVQLQVNRVFWVLDTVALGYVAWFAFDGMARWRPRYRTALVVVLAVLAIARGAFVVRGRPFVTIGLPQTSWTNAMAWLAERPSSWNVLADPSHAWRYGVSVRVAARKDTLLEASKDPAFAIYSRDVALRVRDATAALANFDTMNDADVRQLALRYHVDVFVDRTTRTFNLPVLFKNDQFVIYDLR